MKISLTPWQQKLVVMAIIYASDMGFLKGTGNEDINKKEYQKIIDKMSIDTPVKTGGYNQFYKPNNNEMPIL